LASSLSRLKTSLDAQVAKLSVNERRLLLVLTLVATAGLAYLAFSFQLAARNDHTEAQNRFSEAEQAAGRATSGALASDLARGKAEVREWTWQGSTIEVAQVRAQSQIAEIAANTGLANAEIKTSDKFETAGDVTLAPFEIQAPFSWPALAGFMSGLTATGKGFVVEQVQLTTDRDMKVRISLKAPLTVIAAPKAQPKTAGKAAVKAAAPASPALKGKTS